MTRKSSFLNTRVEKGIYIGYMGFHICYYPCFGVHFLNLYTLFILFGCLFGGFGCPMVSKSPKDVKASKKDHFLHEQGVHFETNFGYFLEKSVHTRQQLSKSSKEAPQTANFIEKGARMLPKELPSHPPNPRATGPFLNLRKVDF